jgi:hypothetical protein
VLAAQFGCGRAFQAHHNRVATLAFVDFCVADQAVGQFQPFGSCF